MDKRIKELIEKSESDVCVIVIDGRAAAGKTTLAESLAKELNTVTIRMDDFFLPKALRTAERFAEAGGNVHYERFIEEVLPKLKKSDSFSYRIFDCQTMDFGDYRTVPQSRYRIVEGSYSLHPKFGSYADVSIFCDIDEKIQLERILNRNGEKMLERFRNEWIPMEEKYLHEFIIRNRADIVY